MSLTPAFEGEVQFRRWSDSSTQGVQVTFALPDSEALEPLKHKAGKRFMAVLVEIGDDEQPVQQPPKKDQRGPLCREACDYCKLPEFQEWASGDGGYDRTEDGAKDFILDMCGLEKSRTELDGKPEAAAWFVQQVRVPFMKWQRERRHLSATASAGY
jgi:hypothetical protein